MQISAANLLLVAQQGVRPPGQPSGGTTIGKPGSATGTPGFETITFKSVSAPPVASTPVSPAPSLLSALGGLLDIHI